MAKKKDHRSEDGIAAAIRLLTDAGYVVLRAPTWPSEVEIALERPASIDRVRFETPGVNQTSVRSARGGEFMTVKEFCGRYLISRSAAYVEIGAGRLKIQKIGRSTRIGEQAASEWLNAWNSRTGP